MNSVVRTAILMVAAVLAIIASTTGAYAQATTGELTGRVTDPGGQLVAGAVVTATNTATGLARSVTTNDRGEYTLTLLPPGQYSVSAERTGFKKAVRSDVSVLVGTRQPLNIALEVGQVTEAVTVSSGTALVNTTSSELGGVVTSRDIATLPLLNRTFANLSLVMPEARPAGNFDPTKTRVGNFAMSGGDGRQVSVNVDGGDNKDNVVGSLLQNFAYEGIQEFQVLQHRWTAESGRAVGGVVNVISKSGANTTSGSLFGTYRNQDMIAKDFFQKRGASKGNFERREFGGSVGGALKKDSLFYFGALERFDEPSGFTPLRSDAVFQQIAAIPGAAPVRSIPTPYDDTLLTVKVDHRISPSQSMFYRLAWQKNSSPNDQVSNPATTDLSGGNSNENTLWDFVGNHTKTIGSSNVNQFAFHFQDFKNEILEVTKNPIMIFPTVRIGPAPNTPQATLERKFQLRNDFTWMRGNHNMKTGVNYLYTDLGGYFYFGAFGYQLTWFSDPLTIATDTATYPQGFATPGAVRNIDFFDGAAGHDQVFHQLALYAQDDWKVNRNWTLNLGIRWDANIGLLTDQTNNRTMALLSQLDEPRANAITDDASKLSRTTPSWKEFQPRLGFVYDRSGDGKFVVRGGYGLFFDQIFQNLTIFSLAQSGPQIYSQVMALTNSAVGVGQAATFRFGVDPLPAPPAFNFTNLPAGSFGRINDPDMSDPYTHKMSIGFEKLLGGSWVLSSDWVHTEGRNEPRVQVINPQIRSICDPAFAGSTPTSARCPNGASSRYFDQAFVAAGLGVNRLGQINMIGTTNRSRFDSLTTTLKGRAQWGRVGTSMSMSYILARSVALGGQPTASYSGNGIAISPTDQELFGEWGPTRHDERHRFVASGTLDFPWDFQIAPIIQIASSRPYSPVLGIDFNGDGLVNFNDRPCAGVSPAQLFAVRGNINAIRALSTPGCGRTSVNSQRTGFVVNPDGSIEERSGRFLNVDLRVAKQFAIGSRAKVRVFADFYNVFNTENLSFTLRPEQSVATSASTFMQPVSLFGPGFGPPVGRPFTASFGARIAF